MRLLIAFLLLVCIPAVVATHQGMPESSYSGFQGGFYGPWQGKPALYSSTGSLGPYRFSHMSHILWGELHPYNAANINYS